MNIFKYLYFKAKRKIEISGVNEENVKTIPLNKLVAFGTDLYSKNEFVKAKICWEEAAKRGDEFSLIQLSHMYSSDFYGFENRKLAIELLSSIALSSSRASKELAFIMDKEELYDKAYYYAVMSVIIDNGISAHGLVGTLNRKLEVSARELIISDVRNSAKAILIKNPKWYKWLTNGCPV